MTKCNVFHIHTVRVYLWMSETKTGTDVVLLNKIPYRNIINLLFSMPPLFHVDVWIRNVWSGLFEIWKQKQNKTPIWCNVLRKWRIVGNIKDILNFDRRETHCACCCFRSLLHSRSGLAALWNGPRPLCGLVLDKHIFDLQTTFVPGPDHFKRKVIQIKLFFRGPTCSSLKLGFNYCSI